MGATHEARTVVRSERKLKPLITSILSSQSNAQLLLYKEKKE